MTELPFPRGTAAKWLMPALAVIISILISGLFVLMNRSSPVEAYRLLLEAGFSCKAADRCALLTTLQFATPLALTGLSAAVAFRVGMFSIGQAGQMILGAAAAAWLSAPLGLPAVPQTILALLGGLPWPAESGGGSQGC